jgi:hypothetical protein
MKKIRAAVMVASFLMAIFYSTVSYADSPNDVFTNAGLQLVDRTWIVPEELEFRQRLPDLEKKLKQINELRVAIEKESQSQIAIKERLAKINSSIQSKVAAQKTAPPGSPQLAQIDRELKQLIGMANPLNAQIVPPEKWGQQMPLKKQLWDYAALRAEVLQSAAELRRIDGIITRNYAKVAKMPEIIEAFKTTSNVSLGPAKTHIAELADLAKIDAVVYGDSVPVFRDGRFWRVSVFFNEEIPITMSWVDSQEFTFITRAMADTLGLRISRAGPVEILTVDKQPIPMQPIDVASVRIGARRKKAKIYVLPPEAESLGARIGYQLQNRLGMRLAPELLHVYAPAPQPSDKKAK